MSYSKTQQSRLIRFIHKIEIQDGMTTRAIKDSLAKIPDDLTVTVRHTDRGACFDFIEERPGREDRLLESIEKLETAAELDQHSRNEAGKAGYLEALAAMKKILES